MQNIKQNRLYEDLVHLWPFLSPPEDYAEEAKHWREILRAKLGSGKHHILELGVGGGNNLSHLTGEFKATAVDISEGMLEHSRKLNPDVEHIVGDMRSVRLNRKFDAVIIHDAIGYMFTENDLLATFRQRRPIWIRAAYLSPRRILVPRRSPIQWCIIVSVKVAK